MLIVVLMYIASVSAGVLAGNERYENENGLVRGNPTAKNSTGLELAARLEGLAPYLPDARYVITIAAPQFALQQGWRCCWIEAYSLENAKILSRKFMKSVQGNPPDIVFDAARTEASIRQIAPNIFQADVAIGSTRAEGGHLARLYVHLYRIEEVDISSGNGIAHTKQRGNANDHGFEPASNRVALNFLEASALPIRFSYAPSGHNWGSANPPRDAVPSQLPNRGAPQ